MTAALDQLVRLLDLEQIDLATFRGDSPETTLQRVYGGQVAGQSLVAAGRTVPPERPVHSLHAYFLRPGEPGTPVLYHVDRIRDGGHLTTRRVVAIQNGRAIFNLAASFHAAEQGVEHQVDMPAVPPPDALPTWHERLEPWADQLGAFYRRPRPIDVRYVSDPPWAVRDGSPRAPRSLVWLRADGRLPDDPLVHVCALTYASDMTLLDAVLRVHGLAWGDGRVSGASLDHAMWFHRPFRADEWLLYETEAPSSSAGRGLAQGRLFRRDGGLAVSVVQEGLLRVR